MRCMRYLLELKGTREGTWIESDLLERCWKIFQKFIRAWIKYKTAEYDANKYNVAKSCLQRFLNSFCIARITLMDPRRHLGAIWKIGDSLRSFRRRVLQSKTTVLLFRAFHPSSIAIEFHGYISGQSLSNRYKRDNVLFWRGNFFINSYLIGFIQFKIILGFDIIYNVIIIQFLLYERILYHFNSIQFFKLHI